MKYQMKKINRHDQANSAIELAAAEWFLLMQSDHVSNGKYQEFDNWLALSPLHREAYLDAEILSDAFTVLSQSPEGRAISDSVSFEEAQASSQVNSRSQWFLSLFGVLLPSKASYVAAFMLLFTIFGVVLMSEDNSSPSIVSPTQQRFVSQRSDIQTVNLSDGTLVILGAESEIIISLEMTRRNVTLIRGEAFFDVAKDSVRPFYVETDELSVKVVGTRFDVRKHPSNTSVSVVEGVVQVFVGPLGDVKQDPLGHPLMLVSGQKAEISDEQGLQTKTAPPLEDIASWRNGRLVYNNSELRDVLSDANRYTDKGKILIEGDKLFRKKVTLSLKISEVDDLPKMLSELLSVDIKKFDGDTILLQQ